MWSETGELLVSFWGADLAGFGKRGSNGEIVVRHWTSSAEFSNRMDFASEVQEEIAAVLDSGFLTWRAISSSPEPLLVAFLPITQENQVTKVLLVGHRTSGPLPKDLLNTYLALAGLVGTTAARLASEAELKVRRRHLEELVEERTTQLTEANELLQQEVSQRQRANEFLNSVLEALTHPFYVINPDDYTIEMANSAAAMYGCPTGSTCYSVTYNRDEPCDGLEHPCPLEEVKKTKRPVTIEHVHFGKDGSRRQFEIHAYPLLDSEENVSQVIEYWVDITERKRAEDALKKSQVMLASVLNSVPQSIFWKDRDGVYLGCNEVVARAVGLESPDQIVGKTDFDMPWPREEAYAYRAEDQEVMANVKAKRHIIEPLQTADGTRLWIDTTKVPLCDENGAVYGVLGVWDDITDRKREEDEREQLRSQLFQAQKMEAIGTLTGGIAHDFNNLLTIINGYAELILSDMPEDDSCYSDLKKILETGRKGADLVQRMLVFSKNAEISLKPLDVNRIVKNSTNIIGRTFDKIVEIKTILGKNLGKVNADAVQLAQVLVNLCINAKEAMPEGGRLTIKTSNVTVDDDYCRCHAGAKPGRHVLLEVSDTGAGMDKETLDRMFDPFFTTKERDFRKGTGLGLSVAKGIVEQHGGWMAGHSELGVGTTFKVCLPVMETSPVGKKTEGETETVLDIEKILLVDDEANVRELGKRVLARAGYTVITAENGRAALEIYARERSNIALVILDLIMPEMGGEKCLEELLKIDPHLKVVVSTGHSVDAKQLEHVGTLIRGFVNKPYDMERLVLTVRGVLDGD